MVVDREHPAGGLPAASGEPVPPEAVQAELDRILASPGFRFSERLSRFLKFAIEQRLAGNAGQLKESVLAVEIFDRQATYDSRVDSVVRVEARRLREKLDKYYRTEGVNDTVIINLPKGTYVPAVALRPPPVSPETRPAARPRHVPLWLVLVSAAALVLVAVALTTWIDGRRVGRSAPVQRLTSDAGLTFQPALSPDGKLLAYSSDRSGRGDLDIWVQQVPRGVPVRVTDSAADESQPAFSPDGTLIAYRREGEQEGIYVVPALGGRSRLVVRGGFHPRFSPDGTCLAYWTGERTFRSAKVFTIALNGGTPVQLQPDFPYAAFPVWSPDGKNIVFVGARKLATGDPDMDDWDWWVAPVAGGNAIRTLARQALDRQGLRLPEAAWAHRRIIPESVMPGNKVVFAARSGDQTNIWRLRLSRRDWQVTGPAEQVTFGAGRQDHPSMAKDGSLVYAALTQKSDIWSLPVRANTAEPAGLLVKVTSGPSNCNRPVASRDGSRIAFISDRTGNEEIWVKDLKSGRELAVTSTGDAKSAVILSPDGSRLAFGYAAPGKRSIFTAPLPGGEPARLCADCGLPRSWLADGRGLVYQWLSPAGESVLGILAPSGKTTELVRLSNSAVFSPSVSADGNWMALILRTPPNDHEVAVVPLARGAAAPRQQWIRMTEPGAWVDKPRWSPNGSVLYYVSNRDGFVCIWARFLDPATRKPLGDPKPVIHFHSGRSSLGSVYGLDLAVAEDKLVFNVGESSGNIWLAPSGQF